MIWPFFRRRRKPPSTPLWLWAEPESSMKLARAEVLTLDDWARRVLFRPYPMYADPFSVPNVKIGSTLRIRLPGESWSTAR